MQISLNKINQIFRTIAQSHAQVKEYIGFTEDWEVNAEHSLQYPIVAAYITPGSISIVGKSNNVGFRIAFGDRVEKGDQNKDDVYSDMLQLANDFVALLRVNYRESFRIVSDIPATPFTDFTKDEATGWYIDFIIEIPNAVEICDIPLKNGESPTPPITTATLKNSLGNVISVTNILLYVDNELQAPDAMLTLNGNEFIPAPSNETTDIQLVDSEDAPITPDSVVGSKITVSQGVGSIPVRNSNNTYTDNATPPEYIIPDTNITLKRSDNVDISNTNIPSSTNGNITAPDAVATLKNTLGELISETSIFSSDNKEIVAPDGYARPINSDGEPLPIGYTAVPCESSVDITIQNSPVYINGNLYKSVKPEQSLAINLIDQNDNQITPSETDPETGTVVITIDNTTKLIFYLPETALLSDEYTIVPDNAGVYTSSTNDGGSGSVFFIINGTEYSSFPSPLTLSVGYVVQTRRTNSTGIGFVTWEGTY